MHVMRFDLLPRPWSHCHVLGTLDSSKSCHGTTTFLKCSLLHLQELLLQKEMDIKVLEKLVEEHSFGEEMAGVAFERVREEKAYMHTSFKVSSLHCQRCLQAVPLHI